MTDGRAVPIRTSEPLTADMLRRAVERSSQRYRDEAIEQAERLEKFYAAVPERLRSHPLIAYMASYVAVGAPMHPADHRALRQRYEELLASE